MQQTDDRHPGPRRPSLFSEEPVAPPEDKGILNQLDGKSSVPARPATTSSSKAGKIAGGVLGLGVVAGGLVWAFGYNDDTPDGVTPQAVAQPALAVAGPPAPRVQAQAAEAPVAQKTAVVDEHEVSAATILDNTTAEDPSHSLSRVLETPTPAPTGAKDELTSAIDRPAEAGKHAASAAHGAKAHDKAGAKDRRKADAKHREHEESARAAHEASARRAAKKRAAHGAAAGTDDDVAILEALIAHGRPAKQGAAKKASRPVPCAADDGEEGAGRSADCKPQPAAKAAG